MSCHRLQDHHVPAPASVQSALPEPLAAPEPLAWPEPNAFDPNAFEPIVPEPMVFEPTESTVPESTVPEPAVPEPMVFEPTDTEPAASEPNVFQPLEPSTPEPPPEPDPALAVRDASPRTLAPRPAIAGRVPEAVPPLAARRAGIAPPSEGAPAAPAPAPSVRRGEPLPPLPPRTRTTPAAEAPPADAAPDAPDAPAPSGRLPATLAGTDQDGPQSLPALLLAASRGAATTAPAVDDEAVDQQPVDEEPVDEEPVDEEPVDEEPVDDDPIDQEPMWGDEDDAAPPDGFVRGDTGPVNPALVPVAPPAPVILPWSESEPEPQAHPEGAAPLPRPPVRPPVTSNGNGRRAAPKARVTPHLVPPLLVPDVDPVAVSASSIWWETRPADRLAPALPSLRRYVPATANLPEQHHDLDGLSGEGTTPDADATSAAGTTPGPSVDGGSGPGVPTNGTRRSSPAHEPAHSGLLFAAEVSSDDGEVLDRGDMGEGRVGQTLEAARIHGLEVVHAHRFGPAATLVDHLVIAANGVWVVHAVDVLDGKLERRDLGDWFDADPRLYVDQQERSDLLAIAHEQADAIATVLAGSEYSHLEVRPVLCFGTVQPAWFNRPFTFDRVSITCRRYLVEPMLDPVVLDLETRATLTRWFAKGAQGA